GGHRALHPFPARRSSDLDGAGAALCRGDAASPGGERGWAVRATGALLLPDSAEDMTWRIGDHGFRMTLSARVPDLIRARLGGWLDRKSTRLNSSHVKSSY